MAPTLVCPTMACQPGSGDLPAADPAALEAVVLTRAITGAAPASPLFTAGHLCAGGGPSCAERRCTPSGPAVTDLSRLRIPAPTAPAAGHIEGETSLRRPLGNLGHNVPPPCWRPAPIGAPRSAATPSRGSRALRGRAPRRAARPGGQPRLPGDRPTRRQRRRRPTTGSRRLVHAALPPARRGIVATGAGHPSRYAPLPGRYAASLAPG